MLLHRMLCGAQIGTASGGYNVLTCNA